MGQFLRGVNWHWVVQSLLAFAFVLLGFTAPVNHEAFAGANPDNWWNTSYAYRRKLTITAGSVNAPTAYSVSATINHASLVSSGYSLANGNDVRIVYWNGSTWTELDRMLDPQSSWNNAATRVWFRTQGSMTASSSNDNYYVYYGNASAGSPPANWANVYLLYDDFSAGSLNTTLWGSNCGTCTQSGGILTIPGGRRIIANTSYAFGANTRWECYTQLGGDGSIAYFNYCGSSASDDNYGSTWITLLMF